MLKKLVIILIGLIIVSQSTSVCLAAVSEQDEATPLKGSALLIDIKSDLIRYNPEEDKFYASGNVVVDVEDQGVSIESNELVFDQANQEIISEKNVKIIKRDTIIYGDYAKFDLTKDTALIGKPNAELTQVRIDAETAEIVSGDMELLKGKVTLNQQDMVMMLSTGSFGGGSRGRGNNLAPEKAQGEPKLKYDIKAKEVILDEYDEYNIITLKNATIKINKFTIAKAPVMQLTTDKDDNRIETMLPEFGSRRQLGAYFGHGHVFHLPKGSTLKALPIVAWAEKGVGFGGMARFMSNTNRTEMLYSSLKNKVVIEGTQDLNFISPDTYLQYGSNAFIDNGFFGRQDPKYIVEVVDDRLITKAYNFAFSLRSSAGYAEEANNYSTTKFQLQGNLNNIESLISYKNHVHLGVSSNFSLAAYGTGDSQGVVRAGPTLALNLGPVNLWTAYYQGAIYGESPFLYDRYLYGKSNVMFQGTVRISKYLTLGYSSALNLTEDNWNQEMVVENQIFAWVGPDELKFKIGYDAERERTVFGFDMLVGSDSSALEFDKLKVRQK